jgi:hypothetical protein
LGKIIGSNRRVMEDMGASHTGSERQRCRSCSNLNRPPDVIKHH